MKTTCKNCVYFGDIVPIGIKGQWHKCNWTVKLPKCYSIMDLDESYVLPSDDELCDCFKLSPDKVTKKMWNSACAIYCTDKLGWTTAAREHCRATCPCDQVSILLGKEKE